MIVCEHCLEAIESHEGKQTSRKLNSFDDEDKIVYGYYDDDDNFVEDECAEENVFCEWCEEYVPINEAYEI